MGEGLLIIVNILLVIGIIYLNFALTGWIENGNDLFTVTSSFIGFFMVYNSIDLLSTNKVNLLLSIITMCLLLINDFKLGKDDNKSYLIINTCTLIVFFIILLFLILKI